MSIRRFSAAFMKHPDLSLNANSETEVDASFLEFSGLLGEN